MADAITIKALQDASLDAKSLEEVVNGDDARQVTTRLGESYPSVKKAIKTLFENGGLPAEPFETKALMTASALVDGDFAQVTDDTVNNGLYVKTAGAWVKSSYDPLAQMVGYVDTNPKFKVKQLTASDNLNDFKVSGEYHKISSSDIVLANGYPVKLAGALIVVGASSSTALQSYRVFSTGVIYRRYMTGGSFTTWSRLDLPSSLEWTPNTIGTATYNDVTRVVTTVGSFLASFNNGNTNSRVRISDISVAMSGDYDICYLDLVAAINDGVTDITSTNQSSYIKVSSYATTTERFTSREGQVPLFKYDAKLKTVVSCAGFIPISGGASADYPDHLEWNVSATGSVNYVSATRTVNINQYVIASYRGVVTNRLRIGTVSVALPNDFDVCFLDLKALGAVDNIDSTNAASVLKVGSYDRKTGDYFNKPWELPLFKYSTAQGKVVPCAGFVAIASDTDVVPSSGGGTGMEFGKSATLCDIYINQPSGNKLKVGLLHQIFADDPLASTQSNADLWRLYKLTRCGADYSVKNVMTTDGEFELAITHTEDTQTVGVAKDHVGGVHGDELLTDAKIFVDGCMINTADVVSLKPADKVELIQHSVIYFQNTTRPMCDHYKHITIADGVINVKQTIDFKYEALSLNSAWIAMLPILRTDGSYQITDKSANSLDKYLLVTDNTTTDFPRTNYALTDGVIIKQWSTASNISAQTKIVKAPNDLSTQSFNITNSPLYNKLYVSAKNAGSSTPEAITLGTVWDVETEYDVKC